MNTALIFAGGVGNRMNTRSKPKQFLQLYGKELIVHTIENFQNHPEIDSIAVVCVAEWIDYFNQLIAKYHLDKVKWVVAGGESGQESIYNGLRVIQNGPNNEKTTVLIHDGVRPFVDDLLISNCIRSVKEKGSAVTVVPAIETIVTARGDEIETITDRSKCYHAKAPQCFSLGEILKAHEQAITDGVKNIIDSASLMGHYGHRLHIVQGGFDNIKITTPEDFYLFRALHDVKENQQIFGI